MGSVYIFVLVCGWTALWFADTDADTDCVVFNQELAEITPSLVPPLFYEPIFANAKSVAIAVSVTPLATFIIISQLQEW